MIRVFDFDSLFILPNASLQFCKFASLQVCKFASYKIVVHLQISYSTNKEKLTFLWCSRILFVSLHCQSDKTRKIDATQNG